MDPLCQIANNFLRLTRFSYRFELGKKGRIVDIDLRFDRGHFHHLAGFQYLRDIDFIRTAEREVVFHAVLEERITMASLKKSPNFQKILPRLSVLNNLENYLDSDQLIFRYLEEKSFSKIKADYLLENHLNDSISYLFIAKNNEWFAAVSLFEKGTQNYSKGMPKYAIL